MPQVQQDEALTKAKYPVFRPYDRYQYFCSCLREIKKMVEARFEVIMKRPSSDLKIQNLIKTKRGIRKIEDAAVSYVREILNYRFGIPDAHSQGAPVETYPLQFRIKVYRRSLNNSLVPSLSLQPVVLKP